MKKNYKILFKGEAEKEFKKLPNSFRGKVAVILNSIAEDPFIGKKLHGEYKNYYSVRVWPYRIVYRILKKEIVVVVVKIKHRKDAYK